MDRSAEGLVLRDIVKHYPGTTALNGVDLEVGPGQVVALLGENGAGKSTLAGIVAGVTPPTSGRMSWRGADYAPASPGAAIQAGIGLIHQEMRLLPDLTVAENVMIGRWPRRGGFLDTRAMRRRAAAQLDDLGFTGRMDQPVRQLNVAAQQQVEIAKALLLQASLLIFDEPTAALGDAETTALFERITALKDTGVAIVYVSHRLAEIARIADRIVVLRDGGKVAEHEAGDIAPAQLVREMVGRSVDRLFPTFPEPGPDTVLAVDGITDTAGRFQDVTFSVRAGEVLGIAGIVGAGRTELVRSVAGLSPRSAGQVSVDGKVLRANHLHQAAAAGVVLIPEDRKEQGLIVTDTIEDNIALPNLGSVASGGGVVHPGSVRRFATGVAERFGIKGRVADPVSSLSGGNQQKVVLGKWLARDPRVVILDEPTRGIDVGARAAIYEIVAELAAAGKAVVVVSSDLEEVLGLSHRVLVLADGRVRGVLDRSAATADSVMHLAVTTAGGATAA